MFCFPALSANLLLFLIRSGMSIKRLLRAHFVGTKTNSDLAAAVIPAGGDSRWKESCSSADSSAAAATDWVSWSGLGVDEAEDVVGVAELEVGWGVDDVIIWPPSPPFPPEDPFFISAFLFSWASSASTTESSRSSRADGVAGPLAKAPDVPAIVSSSIPPSSGFEGDVEKGDDSSWNDFAAKKSWRKAQCNRLQVTTTNSNRLTCKNTEWWPWVTDLKLV